MRCMMTCPVSRYRSAQLDKHALSVRSRELCVVRGAEGRKGSVRHSKGECVRSGDMATSLISHSTAQEKVSDGVAIFRGFRF